MHLKKFDYKAQNVFWGDHCIHSMCYEMECIETWPNEITHSINNYTTFVNYIWNRNWCFKKYIYTNIHAHINAHIYTHHILFTYIFSTNFNQSQMLFLTMPIYTCNGMHLDNSFIIFTHTHTHTHTFEIQPLLSLIHISEPTRPP